MIELAELDNLWLTDKIGDRSEVRIMENGKARQLKAGEILIGHTADWLLSL
jgi:hypothetical protein